jgi:hypothetical protein
MNKLKKEKFGDQLITVYEFVAIITGCIEIDNLSYSHRVPSFTKLNKNKFIEENINEYKKLQEDILQNTFTDQTFPEIKSTVIGQSDPRPSVRHLSLYLTSDLIEWFFNKFDFDLPSCPEWIHELKPQTQTNAKAETEAQDTNTKNGFIELSKLPKYLQLLINIHNSMDWDNSDKNTLKACYLSEAKKLGFQIPKEDRQANNEWSLNYSDITDTENGLSNKIAQLINKLTKPRA